MISLQIFSQITDTISMGAGYANDIFYSVQDGSRVTKERVTRHISFSAEIMSAAIRANNGASVEVYLYPGDTTQFAGMDTTAYSG